MSESVHARQWSGRERCPYCHEEFASASDEPVECSGCGTPHHDECFELNRGCSALGCASNEVKTRRIRGNPLVTFLVWGGLLVVPVFALALPQFFGTVWVILALWAVWAALHHEFTIEIAHEHPVPWARTLPPAHGLEAAQLAIATSSRRATGTLPEPRGPSAPCPSCQHVLEGTEDLRFCYHCGASLA